MAALWASDLHGASARLISVGTSLFEGFPTLMRGIWLVTATFIWISDQEFRIIGKKLVVFNDCRDYGEIFVLDWLDGGIGRWEIKIGPLAGTYPIIRPLPVFA